MRLIQPAAQSTAPSKGRHRSRFRLAAIGALLLAGMVSSPPPALAEGNLPKPDAKPGDSKTEPAAGKPQEERNLTPKAKLSFVRACVNDGNEPNVCTCLINGIEAYIPADEVAAFAVASHEGKAPPQAVGEKVTRIFEACQKQRSQEVLEKQEQRRKEIESLEPNVLPSFKKQGQQPGAAAQQPASEPKAEKTN